MMDTVLIVGGGIGGLTAAIAFARQDFEVHLFEQAEAFAEVGAGIQLSPNCVRVLHYLGLERPLAELADQPERVMVCDGPGGRQITEMSLGNKVWAEFGFPYYHIHRADLLKILLDDATVSDRIHLHTSANVRNYSENDKSVSVVAGDATFEGQLLVGADGLHSTIRNRLIGQASPRYTGNVAWRALVPARRLSPDQMPRGVTVWWGPGKHFVAYPLRNRELLNCVAVTERDEHTLESWTNRADPDELSREFGGWHEPVRAIIEKIDNDNCFKWGLFDRPPARVWHRGRVALLGDACHPVLPFLAQGAAMAIEDAAILAASVSKSDSLPEALDAYQQLRKPRCNFVYRASARNAGIFHMRGPLTRIRNFGAGWAQRRITEKLYGYDAIAASR
ncbi:MAG: FAD-dependent monooxygenase [Pseudomonadales bacterium]|nr:FAD-dependent monooxygenase [Pseudomonadales bacterium]